MNKSIDFKIMETRNILIEVIQKSELSLLTIDFILREIQQEVLKQANDGLKKEMKEREAEAKLIAEQSVTEEKEE